MNSMLNIFWQFLLLGCISFGGPTAHIGYFRQQFVQKLNWIDDQAYAKLIALSQFLPGPGSSQVGFALGLRRGGLAGGIAAFVGFTLPSFLLMYFIATFPQDSNSTYLNGVIHGLKLLAVVVVADAILSMFSSFCKTKITYSLAAITTAVLIVFPGIFHQIGMLIAAALVGIVLVKEPSTSTAIELQKSPKVKVSPLMLFVVLLFGLPFIANVHPLVSLFSDFYQSGSLVFGGGHVVLPILEQTVSDQMTQDRFLVGYAVAQGVPGPMFTMATFLGADLYTQSALIGALIATLAIFLPGFLLVLALHQSWEQVAQIPVVSNAVIGINAAVVGLLIAALYSPVFSSAVVKPLDMALVVVGFLALRGLKVHVVGLVGGYIMVGLVRASFQ